MVLLYGLIPVIPACLLAGIMLSKFFRKLDIKPPKGLFEKRVFKEEELPGLTRSILTILTPVILMLFGAAIDLIFGQDAVYNAIISERISNQGLVNFIDKIILFLKFCSDANMALLIAVLVGLVTLGLKQGKKMPELMKNMSKAASSIAMIVLIIAAGGAFKQVLIDSGVSEYIKGIASTVSFNPLILGWCIAAVIRLAVGSATVATKTAAGIMLPVISISGVSPELLVLATGSGSLMFSHFNDIGFWMFKEYYNVSIKQTFAIWTVMESIVAIVGLIAALLLSLVI
jgi:gluconate transporter